MNEFLGAVFGVLVILVLIIGIYSARKHDDATVSFKNIWKKISGFNIKRK